MLLLMSSAESVRGLSVMGGSNLSIWNISRSLGLAKSGHCPSVFSSWLERNADYVCSCHECSDDLSPHLVSTQKDRLRTAPRLLLAHHGEGALMYQLRPLHSEIEKLTGEPRGPEPRNADSVSLSERLLLGSSAGMRRSAYYKRSFRSLWRAWVNDWRTFVLSCSWA